MLTNRNRAMIHMVMLRELGRHDSELNPEIKDPELAKKIGYYYSGQLNWCSEFVSYVMLNAGVPFTGGEFTSSIRDIVPPHEDGTIWSAWMQRSAKRITGWYEDHGLFVDRSHPDWYDIEPKVGDYVFISRASDPNREHSGLVEYVDSKGHLHTIEGNNAGRKVSRYVYPHYKINNSDDGPANGVIGGIGIR